MPPTSSARDVLRTFQAHHLMTSVQADALVASVRRTEEVINHQSTFTTDQAAKARAAKEAEIEAILAQHRAAGMQKSLGSGRDAEYDSGYGFGSPVGFDGHFHHSPGASNATTSSSSSGNGSGSSSSTGDRFVTRGMTDCSHVQRTGAGSGVGGTDGLAENVIGRREVLRNLPPGLTHPLGRSDAVGDDNGERGVGRENVCPNRPHTKAGLDWIDVEDMVAPLLAGGASGAGVDKGWADRGDGSGIGIGIGDGSASMTDRRRSTDYELAEMLIELESQQTLSSLISPSTLPPSPDDFTDNRQQGSKCNHAQRTIGTHTGSGKGQRQGTGQRLFTLARRKRLGVGRAVPPLQSRFPSCTLPADAASASPSASTSASPSASPSHRLLPPIERSSPGAPSPTSRPQPHIHLFSPIVKGRPFGVHAPSISPEVKPHAILVKPLPIRASPLRGDACPFTLPLRDNDAGGAEVGARGGGGLGVGVGMGVGAAFINKVPLQGSNIRL